MMGMETGPGVWLDGLYGFLSHQVFYSTIVAAIVFAVIVLGRIKNPALVLGLWSLVLLRLVLPTDLASPVSFRALADRFEVADYIDAMKPDQTANSAPVVDQPLIQAPSNKTSIPKTQTGTTWITPTPNPAGNWQTPVPERQTTVPERPSQALYRADNGHAVEPSEVAHPAFFAWQRILILFWLVVSAILGVRFYLRSASFSQFIRDAQLSKDRVIIQMVESWRQQFGVRRRVAVFTGNKNSSGPVSPFTTGLFHPVIYLPADLVFSKGPKQDRLRALDVVIGHEMAHIRRLDALWVKLENILQILFFFHPIVWFARTQIDLSREKICDRMVLHVGAVEPRRYLDGLIDAVRMSMGQEVINLSRKKRRLAGVPVPSFNPALVKLRERINALKGEDAMKPLRIAPVTIAIAALAACTMPMAATGQAQDQSEEAQPLDPKAVTEAFGENDKDVVKETRIVRDVERKVIKTRDGKRLVIEGYRPMRITGNGMGGLVIIDKDGRKVVGPDGRELKNWRGRNFAPKVWRDSDGPGFAFSFDDEDFEGFYEFQEEYQENLAEAMGELGESMEELHSHRWEVLGEVMGSLGELQGELAEFNVEMMAPGDFDVLIDRGNGFRFYFDDDLEDLSDEEREKRIEEREQRRAEMRVKREERREKMRARIEKGRERIAAMKEYMQSDEFKSKMEESSRAMKEAMQGLKEFQKSYKEKNDQ